MEGNVGIVSDIEWPSRKQRCHTDSNYQSILRIKARRVLKTLPNFPGDITERTVEGILTALETYCVPQKNTTYERYIFRMAIQEDHLFDIFVTDLRRKAEYCDFGAIKDSLKRDQIVLGINDPKLRERLLCKTDLTLEKGYPDNSPPGQFASDNSPLIFKQLTPRSFIHYRAKRVAKCMNPRLNIIQIILRSFIHCRTNYSSFFYPLPSLKIGGELSVANCPEGELSDILEKVIKLCRITEQSQEQTKIFISPTTQMGNINAVKKTEQSVDTTKSKNEDS